MPVPVDPVAPCQARAGAEPGGSGAEPGGSRADADAGSRRPDPRYTGARAKSREARAGASRPVPVPVPVPVPRPVPVPVPMPVPMPVPIPVPVRALDPPKPVKFAGLNPNNWFCAVVRAENPLLKPVLPKNLFWLARSLAEAHEAAAKAVVEPVAETEEDRPANARTVMSIGNPVVVPVAGRLKKLPSMPDTFWNVLLNAEFTAGKNAEVLVVGTLERALNRLKAVVVPVPVPVPSAGGRCVPVPVVPVPVLRCPWFRCRWFQSRWFRCRWFRAGGSGAGGSGTGLAATKDGLLKL